MQEKPSSFQTFDGPYEGSYLVLPEITPKARSILPVDIKDNSNSMLMMRKSASIDCHRNKKRRYNIDPVNNIDGSES